MGWASCCSLSRSHRHWQFFCMYSLPCQHQGVIQVGHVDTYGTLHTAIRLLGWDSGPPGLGVAASLQQGLDGTLKTVPTQTILWFFAQALTLSYQSQVRLAFLWGKAEIIMFLCAQWKVKHFFWLTLSFREAQSNGFFWKQKDIQMTCSENSFIHEKPLVGSLIAST